MIEIINTNIGKMPFSDKALDLSSELITRQLTPLLDTIYENVEIISINTNKNTLRLIVDGDVVPFSYDIVTAFQPDKPIGFRLLGKILH